MKKILIPLFSLILTGCSGDLDLYPETQLTQGNFYNSEAELTQASNDIYRQLERVYDANGIVDIFGERFSDNTCTILTGGADTYDDDLSSHKVKSDNQRVLGAWRTAYNAIFITNDIKEKLENTKVEFSTPELKNRIIAEALFVRSLIYFNMVQAWGDVPLVLKVVTVEESYDLLREDKNVIYDQIISDLQFCKDNLPESYAGKDLGRVTTYAASAVLAKIYMVRKDFERAKTELKRIIDSNHFTLDADGNGVANVDDYKYLFDQNTKNSKESILEIQYLSGVDMPNSHHQGWYTPFLWSFHLPDVPGTFRGSGSNTPNPDVIAEFEEGDPRKDVSIVLGFIDQSVDKWIDYPYTNKYYDSNWQNPGQNVEAIRYADILLLYAEVTKDPTYLNMVRSRVGLPAYGETGYPSKYKTLDLAIEHERRVELSFEFHRFFDLVRTGRALEVLNSKGYNITQDQLVLPLPLAEIDINPALQQNSGY